jgi:hypothetical protein
VAVVLLMRLPFLNQAIQGDDVNYLAGAEHAQVDPLHPTHVRYAYLGEMVDMRGHPHPPLNAWFLAALIAITGTVAEIPFHAAYILFSLIAALSALAIARRLTPHPMAATMLFLSTPAFVINGNSLEADLPFLAFWLLSIALFLPAADRESPALMAASTLAMALASFAAYQSIVLAPIFWYYLWRKRCGWKAAWIGALTPVLVIAAWQLYERSSTGAMPAAVLAGYMQTYALQTLALKLKNAVALTVHLGWVAFLPLPLAAFAMRKAIWIAPVAIAAAIYDPNPLFWLSLTTGLLVLLWCATHIRDFAAGWVLIFVAASLIIFFAGSARYLLPVALPVAILVSRNLKPRWVLAGAGCGLALGMALATVNYQHWDGYRRFAASLAKEAESKRLWSNTEWGLQFYLERAGALPLLRGQVLSPGDIVATSELAYPTAIQTGGGILTETARAEITSPVPLRLVSLRGKSAYSSTSFGLRAFDISLAPIDRVKAETFIEREPSLSYLLMSAPEAESQIVSGVYGLESNAWRWMSGKAVLLLKAPAEPAPIEVKLVIPDSSPARTVSVTVDSHIIAAKTFSQPGTYSLTTGPVRAGAITISADKTFSVPGDSRDLSVILTAAGFVR